jgi:nicotinate-nucleotide adenylyltransferase
MGPPELLGLLEKRLDASLSAKRARHSRQVAELAARLCAARGLDPDKGRIAGLAHDLCKELPRAEQQVLFDLFRAEALARAWPPPAAEASFMAEEILHGPAAAGLLLRDYGYGDRDVLEAVAWHTVGREDMGLLAILVYCADKLEPGRKHVDQAFREACLAMEARAMLLAVVEDSLAWLRHKGWEIAPETLLLYNALRKPV